MYSFFYSCTVFIGNTFNCGNSPAISAKCDILPVFHYFNYMLVIHARACATICYCMSPSVGITHRAYQHFVGLPDALSTGFIYGKWDIRSVHFTRDLMKLAQPPTKNHFAFRFSGLSPLILSSCNSTDGDIRVLTVNTDLEIDAFLNPLALLLCYYTLAIASSFILNQKVYQLFPTAS